jgi:hypothetical protein
MEMPGQAGHDKVIGRLKNEMEMPGQAGHDNVRKHDIGQKKEPSSVTSKAFGYLRLPRFG